MRSRSIQLGDRLGELRGVGDLDLASLVDGFEALADLDCVFKRWKGGKHTLGSFGLEEVVDGEERERQGSTYSPGRNSSRSIG